MAYKLLAEIVFDFSVYFFPVVIYFTIFVTFENNFNRNKFYKNEGSDRQIPLIISVLSSARTGSRKFMFGTHDYPNFCSLKCVSGKTHFSISLSTNATKTKREILQKLALQLIENARTEKHKTGKVVLKGTIIGRQTIAQTVLIRLFQATFNTDDRSKICYKITSHHRDIETIQRNWSYDFSKNGIEWPSAFTTQQGLAQLSRDENDFHSILFRATILPTVSLVAYYFAGVIAAIFVILVVELVDRAWSFHKSRNLLPPTMVGRLLLLTPLAAIFALVKGDVQLFQSVPSIYCAIGAFWTIFTLLHGRHLFDRNAGDQLFKHPIIKLGILLWFVGGYFTNEYLRLSGNEFLWIWYYSYFRLELFVGILASGIYRFFTLRD